MPWHHQKFVLHGVRSTSDDTAAAGRYPARPVYTCRSFTRTPQKLLRWLPRGKNLASMKLQQSTEIIQENRSARTIGLVALSRSTVSQSHVPSLIKWSYVRPSAACWFQTPSLRPSPSHRSKVYEGPLLAPPVTFSSLSEPQVAEVDQESLSSFLSLTRTCVALSCY